MPWDKNNVCILSVSVAVGSIFAMDRWKNDALAKHEHDLKVNLCLVSIISLLEQPAGGFMLREERQNVEGADGKVNQVGRIIEILRGKGNKEFEIFLEMLKKSGYEMWAEKIKESAHHFRQVQSEGVSESKHFP